MTYLSESGSKKTFRSKLTRTFKQIKGRVRSDLSLKNRLLIPYQVIVCHLNTPSHHLMNFYMKTKERLGTPACTRSA